MTSTTPHLVSKINLFNRSAFAAAAVLFGSISVYLSGSQLYSDENFWLHLNLPALLVPLGFWGFTLLGLVGYWWYFGKLELYEDRLEISRFFGTFRQRIRLADIESYKLSESKDKSNVSSFKLILYTGDRKFVMYSWAYDNFGAFKYSLTAGKKVVYESPEESGNRIGGRVILIVTAVNAILLISQVFFVERLGDKEWMLLKATLKEEPVIRSDEDQQWIHFFLKEAPELTFEISSTALVKTLTVYPMNEGDTLFLSITMDEYQKKVSKERPLTFTDRYIRSNQRTVFVYGLSQVKNDEVYVALSKEDCVPEIDKENNRMRWLFVGLFCFTSGIYGYNIWAKRRLSWEKRRERDAIA